MDGCRLAGLAPGGPARSGGPEQKAGIGAPELSCSGGAAALSRIVLTRMATRPISKSLRCLRAGRRATRTPSIDCCLWSNRSCGAWRGGRCRGERPGHLLQPTALVNEAYLRLVDIQRMRWQNRAHFFAVAARLMRRILVDAARSQQDQKRGGGRSTSHWTRR